MSDIRVIRNEQGNCVQFEGTTLPVYWNACLSAKANENNPDNIDIVNNIETGHTGVEKQEMSNQPYTSFSDKDGNEFDSAQEAIDYINSSSNVSGVTGNGIDLLGQTVCFTLDDTNTSIIIDNGFSFGVNTIKAVANEDGTIHIISNDNNAQRTHFLHLEVGNACNKDGVISGGIADVVNSLNELFTVGPFESVVISDPFSTMVADVDGVDAGYTLEGNDAIDPIGPDIFTYDGSGYPNYAGLKSTATIDQAGEYFTFDIRGEGTIGFGLVHSTASFDQDKYVGNAGYANPVSFAGVNSAHYGFQFSHWFHPTPNGSWTNYGAATGYVGGAGWSNWDQKQDWIDGNPVKIRCGIDPYGYISIESLQNDGTWVLHSRSNYVVPQGSEFHLGIKSQSTSARVFSAPKVHLLEPEAPTMYFRYIESPDGVFHYPVFATAEEAEYYDEIVNGLSAGTGSSHTHVYPDDPTNTTWYMPEASHDPSTYQHTSAPDGTETFNNNPINWTEVTSLTNSDLVPSAFSGLALTVNEDQTVNYQTQPMDTVYTTTFQNLPAPLIDLGGGMIGGVAPSVDDDNVNNPSDSYIIDVIRTNTYGSSTGQLTLNVINLTPPATLPSGFTQTHGGLTVDGHLDSGGVVTLDNTLQPNKRMIVNKSWVEANVLPYCTDPLDKAYIGVPSPSANWSEVELHNDFDAVMRWEGKSNNQHHSALADGSDIVSRSDSNVGSATNAYYHYAIQWDGTDLVVMRDPDLTKLTNEHDYTQFSTYSAYENYAEQSGNLPLVMAAKSGGTLSLNLTGISFIDIPAAPVSNLTPWTKAIDFSGSNEHLKQVNSAGAVNAIRMQSISQSAPLNSDTTKTSNGTYSRPWMASVVFNRDNNASNQHIWNLGEGSGNNDDNIYLRVTSIGHLYFGWGRGSNNNECFLGGTVAGRYYGVCVVHSGARFSNPSASQLEDAFKIYLMSSEDGFDNITEVATGWSAGSSGHNMTRGFNGDFTIGGRGSNRNFHGKVASMVVTTLRRNVTMPDAVEAKMIITDPKKWEDTYRDGQTVRSASNASEGTYNTNSSSLGWFGTQIWLMGDGTSDSYGNGIRNQLIPSEQNYTKLQLNSMVSNDIQNVNINGLT